MIPLFATIVCVVNIGGKPTLDPSQLTPWVVGRLTEVRITRYGLKLLGEPVPPRPSRGFRRHIRRVKAIKT